VKTRSVRSSSLDKKNGFDLGIHFIQKGFSFEGREQLEDITYGWSSNDWTCKKAPPIDEPDLDGPPPCTFDKAKKRR
jgi:hypothetical protein